MVESAGRQVSSSLDALGQGLTRQVGPAHLCCAIHQLAIQWHLHCSPKDLYMCVACAAVVEGSSRQVRLSLAGSGFGQSGDTS